MKGRIQIMHNGQSVTAVQVVWVTAASASFCCWIVVYSQNIAFGLHGGNIDAVRFHEI